MRARLERAPACSEDSALALGSASDVVAASCCVRLSSVYVQTEGDLVRYVRISDRLIKGVRLVRAIDEGLEDENAHLPAVILRSDLVEPGARLVQRR